MKAVVLSGITPAEKITISEMPIPMVKPGWILLKVKAFGLNHSEQILRMSEIEAPYIPKPIIPGIECVGEVADPSDSGLKKGQKVIALMGGMGRNFNGSYAEYALLPAQHVFAVESNLSWVELGAIPETYFTAWGSLFESLHLQASDTLLIRGATCALGYTTIQLAKAFGCKVIATTHREQKLSLLHAVDQPVLDDGNLAARGIRADKVLDLVGPRYLYDSLKCTAHGGIVCQTGILGGVFTLNNFDPIKDIPNGVYLTGFFSNYPTKQVIHDLFDFLGKHNLNPIYGATYPFTQIREACEALDGGKVNGKIVVSV